MAYKIYHQHIMKSYDTIFGKPAEILDMVRIKYRALNNAIDRD